MICKTCGERMSGDGYVTALHCPYTEALLREPDSNPLHCENPMKQTHQIAYDYCMAHIRQSVAVEQLNGALRTLGSDNYLFSLCEPLESAYTKLVEGILGPELWDWLTWWMYETNCGKNPMQFSIDGVDYDPTQMTLFKFLETVDAY